MLVLTCLIGGMSDISCNYAVAILRTITQKQYAKKKTLDTPTYSKITEEYNLQFVDYSDMVLPRSIVVKKLKKLMSKFNKKWNPASMRTVYLETFSTTSWAKLSESEKKEHSVIKCTKCPMAYALLHNTFKGNKIKDEEMQITLNSSQLSSPKKCAMSALKQLNAICTYKFGESAQSIIACTPRSQLTTQLSKKRQLQETRKKIKSSIEKAMDDTALELVMGNRISWRSYDRARKAEGLESQYTKPVQKRMHGCKMTSVTFNKEAVLAEARTWSDGQKINWSDMARRHGLVEKNGGQIVKEFLEVSNIAAACRSDVKRAPRRERRNYQRALQCQ